MGKDKQPSHHPPRRDDAGVHTHPVQATKQPGVFDLHAAVVHLIQTRLPGQCIGLGVGHAQLLPQALRTDVHRLLGNRQHVFAAAKHIDHVHLERDVAQAGVASFTEDLTACITRIDRHDLEAMLLHL